MVGMGMGMAMGMGNLTCTHVNHYRLNHTVNLWFPSSNEKSISPPPNAQSQGWC